MSRLCLLALLVPAFASANPTPKEKAKELYFPVQVGAKKVMEQKVNDRSFETTETVTKVEEKDGVYTVTVEQGVSNRRGPSGPTAIVYEVSAKGVFRVSVGGQRSDAPVPELKAGVKAGDTWTAEVRRPGFNGGAGDTAKQTFTVGTEEEVEVPAGKYKAIRMTVESESRGQATKSTYWHAPGVGVVKTQLDLNGRALVREMKSFTPGKGETKDK